jgi:hypothetical protein
MTLKEFKRNYLRQYCLIEKDFANTIDYVSISAANYGTFSPAYLKILLSIGSEIDVLKDCVCKLLNTDMKHFIQVEPDFHSVSVEVSSDEIVLTPWDTTDPFPKWWTAYNEVKHNRNESADKFDPLKKYFEYANLENVLSALAGLYSLELLAYKIVAEQNNEKIFVPCIRSIFQVKNLYWKDISNGSGFVFFDGGLYMDEPF